MGPKDNSPFHTSRIVKHIVFSVSSVAFITILLTSMAAAKLHAAVMESFLLFYSNNIQGETEPCG